MKLVLRLLDHSDSSHDILEMGLGEQLEGLSDRIFEDRPSESVFREGELIAERYRIDGLSGSGGMGTVYRATDEQLDRVVALKVLRADLSVDPASRLMIHSRERDVLASLEHPGIVRLYDAMSEGDEAYLVLEHCPGEALIAHCAESGCDLSTRLELVVEICEAVSFLHSCGVAHGDIKPSNILVQTGTPKLVDFGVAELLGPGGEASDGGTASAFVTPAYAAPERLRGEPPTPASDLFSLGVLARELATGVRPSHTSTAGDLPLPSEAVRSDARDDELARGLPTASRLVRQLKGDFDAIIAKATSTDPGDRYLSVVELSQEISSFLRLEPVAARASSRPARFLKFTKRHRMVSALGALLVTAIMSWGATATIMANRLADERDEAEVARARAERVAEYVTDIFDLANPYSITSGNPDPEVKVRDILVSAGPTARARLDGDPYAQASIFGAIGHTYAGLGLSPDALEWFEDAHEASLRAYPATAPEIASSMLDLAKAVGNLGDYDRADSLAGAALAIFRTEYGRVHERTAAALDALAWTAQALGVPWAEVAAQWEEVLAIMEEVMPSGDVRLAAALHNAAFGLMNTGQADRANLLLRRALSIQTAQLGPDHPDAIDTRNLLASFLAFQGENEQAEREFRELVELQRGGLLADDPSRGTNLNNLAAMLMQRGAYSDAESLYREALDLSRAALGDHPTVAQDLESLAFVVRMQNRFQDAERLYEQAIDLGGQTLGVDHPEVAGMIIAKAEFLVELDRCPEILFRLRVAVGIQLSSRGATHAVSGDALSTLGACLTQNGLFAEAAAVLENAVQILTDERGPDHFATQTAEERLAAASSEVRTGR